MRIDHELAVKRPVVQAHGNRRSRQPGEHIAPLRRINELKAADADKTGEQPREQHRDTIVSNPSGYYWPLLLGKTSTCDTWPRRGVLSRVQADAGCCSPVAAAASSSGS